MLNLTHDTPFNVGVKPVPADFVLISNGVPHALGPVNWFNNTTLRFLNAPPQLVDPVTIEFINPGPNYVTANGFTMDAYGPIIVPDPPLLQGKVKAWTTAHPCIAAPGSPAWIAWAMSIPKSEDL